jgi:hypothetical protein
MHEAILSQSSVSANKLAVPEPRVGKMRIDKMLRNHGFYFDAEHTESEAPAEIWINRKAGLGVRLEWFRLKR